MKKRNFTRKALIERARNPEPVDQNRDIEIAEFLKRAMQDMHEWGEDAWAKRCRELYLPDVPGHGYRISMCACPVCLENGPYCSGVPDSELYE